MTLHTEETNLLMQKLTVLSDSAKYDVACTSSGITRRGDGTHTGNTSSGGICHAFTSDGRCISLLKILLTNECIYDCKYCINRCSNDVPRTQFTPEEICCLTMEFYRRNYIEGLFLSSGILESPNHTMTLLYETLFLLRQKYHFHGYIHVKCIPGASPELTEQIGYLCDRMSVNLELPTADGLRKIAPNKVRRNILGPMRQIQNGIRESRLCHGVSDTKSLIGIDEHAYYAQLAEINDSYARLSDNRKYLPPAPAEPELKTPAPAAASVPGLRHPERYFVPAGQSTQMIIGATPETDYQIISVSEALYNHFDLKRVFYSAFINVNMDSSLPDTAEHPPLLREHRLYQADFLLRFYGFQANELLSEEHPNFHEQIDPKCNWAVHHLEQFPVEINRADYYTLLRVPGIGTKSARRILAARRHASLTFSDIKKMGVVLKRAQYFITCGGRMLYPTRIEEDYITRHLIYNESPARIPDSTGSAFRQMNLFDTSSFAV